jgi:uncharacterized membrane protein
VSRSLASSPPSTSTRRFGPLLATSLALTVVTVLAQIAYPLAPDRQLARLSVVTVLAFAAASVTHALAVRGVDWTLRLVAVVVPGAFLAEAVGIATGFPFGHYDYSRRLGPLVAGVPLLVPLAWLMMAYPCLLLGRLLTRRIDRSARAARVFAVGLLSGGTLAAWDVFLDPQMVAAGNWTWRHPSPGLPGVHGVPLTNLAGWLLAASLLMALAHLLLPAGGDAESADRPAVIGPAVLLTWTWLGGILGNAAFFGRPWVAVWGGLLLGAFVVPYLLLVRDQWRR